MVGASLISCEATALVIGLAQAATPLIQKLDPTRRAAVLMALLGIVIVGLFIVALALLGGNWARRLARHSPTRRQTALRGFTKPIARAPEVTDPSSSSDTIRIERDKSQTKTDR